MFSEAPELLVGNHTCSSCRMVHVGDYAGWCRAERELLFPANFERWTEDEHAAKNRAFTWGQQQTIWAHIDAWEACIDNDLSLADCREFVAQLEPLPPIAPMLRTLAKSMVVRTAEPAAETPNFNERQWLEQQAKPVAA
jgi:hypothetical protein